MGLALKMLKGLDDVLERVNPFNDRAETVRFNRPNHVLLLGAIAHQDPLKS